VWFFFAATIGHELAHAFYQFRFAGHQDGVTFMAHEIYWSEGEMTSTPAPEIGFSWERHTFGCAGTYATADFLGPSPKVFADPMVYSGDTGGDFKEYDLANTPIDPDYLAGLFRREWWESDQSLKMSFPNFEW
jgi:hypothetical protein